ncbi:hypothetical protein H4582DRAFT_2090907 [Lactarius indigo]|nr:hypothetical protein H4582DRAFT_2090907 [Lactarius indigo]
MTKAGSARLRSWLNRAEPGSIRHDQIRQVELGLTWARFRENKSFSVFCLPFLAQPGTSWLISSLDFKHGGLETAETEGNRYSLSWVSPPLHLQAFASLAPPSSPMLRHPPLSHRSSRLPSVPALVSLSAHISPCRLRAVIALSVLSARRLLAVCVLSARRVSARTLPPCLGSCAALPLVLCAIALSLSFRPSPFPSCSLFLLPRRLPPLLTDRCLPPSPSPTPHSPALAPMHFAP